MNAQGQWARHASSDRLDSGAQRNRRDRRRDRALVYVPLGAAPGPTPTPSRPNGRSSTSTCQEAIAEQRYFDYDIADDEARARMRAWQEDLRLPQAERARLGARGSIFASRTVTRLFNQFQGQALTTTLIRPKDEGQRLVARLQVGKAFDAFEAQVRREMGTDKIEPKS